MTLQTADSEPLLPGNTEFSRITVAAAGISEKESRLLDYWLYGKNYITRHASQHSLPPAEGVLYLGADDALIRYLASWNIPYLVAAGSNLSVNFIKNNIFQGLGPVWFIPENPAGIAFPQIPRKSSAVQYVLSVSDPGHRILMKQILLFNRMNPRTDIITAEEILSCVLSSLTEYEWILILDLNYAETDAMLLTARLTAELKKNPDIKKNIKIYFINNFNKSGHRLPLFAPQLSVWSRRIFQPDEAVLALLLSMPSESFLLKEDHKVISEKLIQGSLTVNEILENIQPLIDDCSCACSLFRHVYQEFRAERITSGITLT